MSEPKSKLTKLRHKEYLARLVVERLQREVYSQPDPAASAELLDELADAEEALAAIEKDRIAAQEKDTSTGLILKTRQVSGLLGAATTGLEAEVYLRMAHVPTAISHLFDAQRNPLVSSKVRNAGSSETRRVRVTTFVEDYSAKAVDTAELKSSQEKEFKQMPTLFPDRLKAITELTRATLNVLVEDLDGKVELHKTQPIWLLARTSAPLAVEDPQTGEWQDMTPYFGAFVTPNAPSLMTYLRIAADHHPDGRLVGYQGAKENVPLQVQAIFEALKQESQITYVNSLVDFNPDQGAASQRVRLPRESLADREANCIDGTVLVASLLEGISLSPAIVLVPGHAFVAWETWSDSNEWNYLETTMIGTHTFEQACASGESQAKRQESLAKSTGNPYHFRRMPLRILRVRYGITPME
jgi:hypothetical protein